jgi:hypothetical protein
VRNSDVDCINSDFFARCSTEVDNDGYHILNQEFWGHCSSTCYVDIEGFAIGTVQGKETNRPGGIF